MNEVPESYFFSVPEIASIISRFQLLKKFSHRKELFEFLWKLFPSKDRTKYQNQAYGYEKFSSILGTGILDYYSEEYPALLKEIQDPPAALYYYGDIIHFSMPCISVVGTRKPSQFTLEAIRFLPEYLKKQGEPMVVSGLAEGVDFRAMEECFSAGMHVCGVMGTGPEKEFPRSSGGLYRKMRASTRSLLVTEYPPGFTPGKWAFPRRNRIITGLSGCLIIFETPKKGGSMSSANHAVEQNRSVYVFHDPHQSNNSGGEFLLSEGAERISLSDLTSGKCSVVSREDFSSGDYEESRSASIKFRRETLGGNIININDSLFFKIETSLKRD